MSLVQIKIWDCIDKFKEYCGKSKGWKVYDCEDLIQVENSFHKFIWVRNLQPATFTSVVMNPSCAIQSSPNFAPFDYIDTFKSVVMNPSCAIGEGVSYRMVRISFMAWILPETPSACILRLFEEMPILLRRVALYDLSRVFRGEPTCVKLNETKSVVLQEFEQFLSAYYGIKLDPY